MLDCDLLRKGYIVTDDKKTQHIFTTSRLVEEQISTLETLNISNKAESSIRGRSFFYSLPMRLPMICKPKPFKVVNNKLISGGYLLNDEKFIHNIFLDSYDSKVATEIDLNNNIIIDLINVVNAVAFKINTNVLNFIYSNTDYYDDELLDPNYKHPLTLKEKLTKHEKKELLKYNSLLELQQNILT